MKHNFKSSVLFTALFLIHTLSLSALSLGTVNARRCIEESKFGKMEQAQFDDLRKQLEQGLQNKEKELNDLKPKLSDEYLDTLTPEAEQEVKMRFHQLQQEHQELYYNMSMMLNKANHELMQKLLEKIQSASKVVANAKSFDLILNDEALFYRKDATDITSEVIKQLDASFADRKEVEASSK